MNFIKPTAEELAAQRADPLLWEQELDVRPEFAEAIERAVGFRAGRAYWRSANGHLYALELADLGRGRPSMAKVVVSSRKVEACEVVVDALRKEGREAVAIPCHIGKRADVEALIEKTRQQWGRIDVLVCNAAVNPYYGPTSGLSDEAFGKVMESNCWRHIWLGNLVH